MLSLDLALFVPETPIFLQMLQETGYEESSNWLEKGILRMLFALLRFLATPRLGVLSVLEV